MKKNIDELAEELRTKVFNMEFDKEVMVIVTEDKLLEGNLSKLP